MERRTSTLMLVGVFCTFGPSVLCGFVWDDHKLVVDNTRLHDINNALELAVSRFWPPSDPTVEPPPYYRPVVSLALLAQYQVFGPSPAGYHVVSVVLHLLCVALAIAWLRRRLPNAERVSLAAVLGIAFFALHTTRAESVAWISGSTELWAGFFVLSATLFARLGATLATSFCAVLALFSKESAAVLPLLLASDVALLAPTREARHRGLRLAATVAAAMALGLVGRGFVVPLAQDGIARSSVEVVVSRALSSLGHFVRATVQPVPSTVLRGDLVYSADGTQLFEPWSIAAGGGLVLALIALTIACHYRTSLRPWLADLLWFLVPLLPVLNVLPLQMEALVAERFLYLPLLGVSSLASRAFVLALNSPRRHMRLVATVAGCLLALTMATVSAQRTASFFDDRTLWRDEQANYPDRPYVLERLVLIAHSDRDYGEALRLAKRGHSAAVERHDRAMEARMLMLAALTLLRSTPDIDQAALIELRDFYDAIAENRPAALDAPGTHLQLRIQSEGRELLLRDALFYRIPRALSYMRTLRLDDAATQLEALLAESEQLPDAWVQLATVRARQLRMRDAQAALDRALSLAPGNANAHALRAALARTRQLMAHPAMGAGQAAARSRTLGHVFIVLGAPELARRELDRALAAAPEDPELIQMRARADAADGRFDLARARIERAREALPMHRDFFRGAVLELDALQAQHNRHAPRGEPAGTP